MYITLEEQTSIALGFEKNFAHLIRQVNNNVLSSNYALTTANKLIQEIKTVNRPYYFEEDISQVMTELAHAIYEYAIRHLVAPSPANDVGAHHDILAVA